MFNRLKAADRSHLIKMYAGDWGHPQAQNKESETKYVNDAITRWMNHYLKGSGTRPRRM